MSLPPIGRSPMGRQATYGDYTLTMDLRDSIGVEIFRVNPKDYRAKVMARESIPDGIRVMIIRLFERGTITACEISYGRKMALRLSKQAPSGRQLLLGGALERFQKDLSEITGKRVEVTWEPSGGNITNRRGRSIDPNRVVGTLLNVLDAVSDGINLAASISELFSNG